jgi:hypothetical protein
MGKQLKKLEHYINSILQLQMRTAPYSHVPHNDSSVNNELHIQWWSHNITTLYYNTYHCVTNAYSIQYSNMLYRFVA